MSYRPGPFLSLKVAVDSMMPQRAVLALKASQAIGAVPLIRVLLSYSCYPFWLCTSIITFSPCNLLRVPGPIDVTVADEKCRTNERNGSKTPHGPSAKAGGDENAANRQFGVSCHAKAWRFFSLRHKAEERRRSSARSRREKPAFSAIQVLSWSQVPGDHRKSIPFHITRQICQDSH